MADGPPKVSTSFYVWCPVRQNQYKGIWRDGQWRYFGADLRVIDEEITHYHRPLTPPSSQAENSFAA